MKLSKGQIIELEISDMAIGGKGVAKIDGLVIFVDRVVKGDYVRAKIIKRKKNYLEAIVLEVLSPSSFRQAPLCHYAWECGGCKWQFIDYNQQLEFKQQHVQDAFRHIGLIDDVQVNPVLPSPKIFEYRNKMEFTCSDRRWLTQHEMTEEDQDKSFAIGLHVSNSFNKILDIQSCLLQPALGNQILDTVRQAMKASKEVPYNLKSHEGFWRFCMLRHSHALDQWMVNIITSEEKKDIVEPIADHLIQVFPQVACIVNNITSRKAGVAVGEYEICLRGNSEIKEKIGDFLFAISSNSFFQTNTLGAEQLYNIVKQFADLKGDEIVYDLYCGTGTISMWLANQCQKVIGMELIESAIIDARLNCKNNHINNCTFIHGDIRHLLMSIDQKPDIMIIDPPRAGIHKDIAKQIQSIQPERIIYVSCNPATLARDLGLLIHEYNIDAIQPVDMFPHTFHIETVARLQKK